MRVEVRALAADAARYAAELMAAELIAALADKGRASIALSGGTSPRLLFRELAAHKLDWPCVSVFQVDERIAPAGNPARNIGAIAEELVERGHLPRKNLAPMPVEEPFLRRACADYTAALAAAAGSPPVLDVVHLGLGADGHTASLFAGDPAVDEVADDVAVTEPHAGFRRMTLTLPAINRSRRVVWFATGAAKAEVLSALTRGTLAAPAGRVERARAVLVTDRDV
jgi:6-phosphogluconolactonase